MSTCVKHSFPILENICSAPSVPKVVQLLKSADDGVINSLTEIAYNVLYVDLPMGETDKAYLRQHKPELRSLSNKNLSAKSRRKVAIENPKFIQVLLKGALPILVSFM